MIEKTYRGKKRGRKVPANRKPRYCPECGGNMIKKGREDSKQAWGCRACGFRTVYPDLHRNN